MKELTPLGVGCPARHNAPVVIRSCAAPMEVYAGSTETAPSLMTPQRPSLTMEPCCQHAHGFGVDVTSASIAMATAQLTRTLAGRMALQQLMAGNQRFVDGTSQRRDHPTDRAALANAQHPQAAILACPDSRVAPEFVFDQGLGDLFVVRVAGNVAEPSETGSLEYAVQELKVPLLVVLGHESCGAVMAALQGGRVLGHLGTVVSAIQPAVDRVQARGVAPEQRLPATVQENVLHQAHRLGTSPVLGQAVSEGRLDIVHGVYDLHSGGVEWLSPHGLRDKR